MKGTCSMAEDLLISKTLLPSVPRTALRRASLLGAIDDALMPPGACLSLSAPTGYGKTTLCAQWASEARLPVAWLALDEDDGDPDRFMRYVLAALDAAGARWAEGAGPGEDCADEVAFLNRLQGLEDELVLCLDDVTSIEEAPAGRLLERIASAMPPQLRLILVGEAEPRFFSRLCLREEFSSIGERRLALSDEEVGRMAPQAQLDLDERELGEFLRLAGGWPAAVSRACSAARREGWRPADYLLHECGREGVFGRLFGGMMDAMGPEELSYLLHAALFDSICADLMDALPGDWGEGGIRMLDRVRDEMPFVLDEPSGERGWMRLHPLLQETARARAGRELDARDRDAALRAGARWLGGQGRLEQMMRCAERTGDADFQAECLERAAEALLPRLPDTGGFDLAGWCEATPAEAVAGHPAINVAVALSQLTDSTFRDDVDLQSGIELMESLPREAQGAGEDEQRRYQGLIALLQLARINTQDLSTDGMEMERWVREAEADIPEDDPLRPFVDFNRYACELRIGDKDELHRAGSKAKRSAHAHGITHLELTLRRNECELEWASGRIERCERDLKGLLDALADGQIGGAGTDGERDAVELERCHLLADLGSPLEAAEGLEALLEEVEPHDDEPLELSCRFELALIALACGDADELDEQGREIGRIRTAARLGQALERASVLLQSPEDEAAQTAARESIAELAEERPCRTVISVLGLLEESTDRASREARLLLLGLAGRPEDVDAGLARQRARAEELDFRAPLVLMRLAESLALARGPQTDVRAQELFRQALLDSEESGCILPFLMLAPQCRPALERAAEEEGEAAGEQARFILSSRQHLDALLAQNAGPRGRRTPFLLTEREREILDLVAEGKSNAQIAEALSIELATVKSHLYKIYAKVGVKNRTEAALLAKKSRLL